MDNISQRKLFLGTMGRNASRYENHRFSTACSASGGPRSIGISIAQTACIAANNRQ
jgi:hypothetical protein